MNNNMLLTGCAGFIGSNFVKSIAKHQNNINFVIIDTLGYAGYYPSIEKELTSSPNLSFHKIDIRDLEKLKMLFNEYKFDGVINFAAESHVDNSIKNPNIFVETNVLGTLNLLNCSIKLHANKKNFRFLQISTDEVYGDLEEISPSFTEQSNISPNSPYSASKAAADHLVQAYYETFSLPTLITRCSNNYGPFQNPEKLIPLTISRIMANKKIPIYGTGKNIRDWIFVDDHNDAIWEVYNKGKSGNVYNIGGGCEIRNVEIVKKILSLMNEGEELIEFVEDRKGHDWRYSVDFSKIESELSWKPKVNIDTGLKKTVKWYSENKKWLTEVQNRSANEVII